MNISESGARIEDINRLVVNFHASHPQACDVEKVILSFGTNDIKYDSQARSQGGSRVGNAFPDDSLAYPGEILAKSPNHKF